MKKITVLALAAAASCVVAPDAMGRIPEPVSWQPLPLQLRVLQRGDAGGLAPAGRLRFVRPRPGRVALDAILAGQPGFHAAAVEQLVRGDLYAVDVVATFASGRGARDQVELWGASQRMTTRFAGIPGAIVASGRTTFGIAFADGRFAYLLEARWTGRAAGARARVLSAVAALFGRVHGHPLG